MRESGSSKSAQLFWARIREALPRPLLFVVLVLLLGLLVFAIIGFFVLPQERSGLIGGGPEAVLPEADKRFRVHHIDVELLLDEVGNVFRTEVFDVSFQEPVAGGQVRVELGSSVVAESLNSVQLESSLSEFSVLNAKREPLLDLEVELEGEGSEKQVVLGHKRMLPAGRYFFHLAYKSSGLGDALLRGEGLWLRLVLAKKAVIERTSLRVLVPECYGEITKNGFELRAGLPLFPAQVSKEDQTESLLKAFRALPSLDLQRGELENLSEGLRVFQASTGELLPGQRVLLRLSLPDACLQ